MGVPLPGSGGWVVDGKSIGHLCVINNHSDWVATSERLESKIRLRPPVCPSMSSKSYVTWHARVFAHGILPMKFCFLQNRTGRKNRIELDRKNTLVRFIRIPNITYQKNTNNFLLINPHCLFIFLLNIIYIESSGVEHFHKFF